MLSFVLPYITAVCVTLLLFLLLPPLGHYQLSSLFSLTSLPRLLLVTRYPSVPALPADAIAYALLAFDYMRVSMEDLLWAPSVMPALIEAFPPGATEDDEDLDEEASHSNQTNMVVVEGKSKSGKNSKNEKNAERKEGPSGGSKKGMSGGSKEGGVKRGRECTCRDWAAEMGLRSGSEEGHGSERSEAGNVPEGNRAESQAHGKEGQERTNEKKGKEGKRDFTMCTVCTEGASVKSKRENKSK